MFKTVTQTDIDNFTKLKEALKDKISQKLYHNFDRFINNLNLGKNLIEKEDYLILKNLAEALESHISSEIKNWFLMFTEACELSFITSEKLNVLSDKIVVSKQLFLTQIQSLNELTNVKQSFSDFFSESSIVSVHFFVIAQFNFLFLLEKRTIKITNLPSNFPKLSDDISNFHTKASKNLNFDIWSRHYSPPLNYEKTSYLWTLPQFDILVNCECAQGCKTCNYTKRKVRRKNVAVEFLPVHHNFFIIVDPETFEIDEVKISDNNEMIFPAFNIKIPHEVLNKSIGKQILMRDVNGIGEVLSGIDNLDKFLAEKLKFITNSYSTFERIVKQRLTLSIIPVYQVVLTGNRKYFVIGRNHKIYPEIKRKFPYLLLSIVILISLIAGIITGKLLVSFRKAESVLSFKKVKRRNLQEILLSKIKTEIKKQNFKKALDLIENSGINIFKICAIWDDEEFKRFIDLYLACGKLNIAYKLIQQLEHRFTRASAWISSYIYIKDNLLKHGYPFNSRLVNEVTTGLFVTEIIFKEEELIGAVILNVNKGKFFEVLKGSSFSDYRVSQIGLKGLKLENIYNGKEYLLTIPLNHAKFTGRSIFTGFAISDSQENVPRLKGNSGGEEFKFNKEYHTETLRNGICLANIRFRKSENIFKSSSIVANLTVVNNTNRPALPFISLGLFDSEMKLITTKAVRTIFPLKPKMISELNIEINPGGRFKEVRYFLYSILDKNTIEELDKQIYLKVNEKILRVFAVRHLFKEKTTQYEYTLLFKNTNEWYAESIIKAFINLKNMSVQTVLPCFSLAIFNKKREFLYGASYFPDKFVSKDKSIQFDLNIFCGKMKPYFFSVSIVNLLE